MVLFISVSSITDMGSNMAVVYSNLWSYNGPQKSHPPCSHGCILDTLQQACTYGSHVTVIFNVFFCWKPVFTSDFMQKKICALWKISYFITHGIRLTTSKKNII